MKNMRPTMITIMDGEGERLELVVYLFVVISSSMAGPGFAKMRGPN